jgi:hypothetical protein
MKNKTTKQEDISKNETIDYKSLYEAEVERVNEILKEKTKWENLAKTYANKFSQALKGFLLIQGSSEEKAEAERQKILNSLN